MDYINLGPTGLKVSRLCLGAMTYGSKQWRPWVLEDEEARPFIRKALELGISYFDTADMYSVGKSQEILGRAPKDFGSGRDRVMLATSGRLGLARFVTMQNYYNLIYREEEREMLPLCGAEGIAVTPFSPLARGFVVGNRRKEDYGETVRAKTDEFSRKQYYRPEDFAIVDRVTEIAKKRDTNNAQIALAWVLHQPGITSPIIGASKPGHLEDAIKALAIKLEADELKYLSELYKPRGVLANL